MKKLALDLDALAVESFDTTPDAARARGTVRGNDSPTGAACETITPTTTVPDLGCGCQSGTPCPYTGESVCDATRCDRCG